MIFSFHSYRSQNVVDPAIHCGWLPTHLSGDSVAGVAARGQPERVTEAVGQPGQWHRTDGGTHCYM